MRAVLRATLAARLRARPTAAENSWVSFFTLVRFMAPVPPVLGWHRNYHTHSTRRPKPDNSFENYTSFARSDAAHLRRAHFTRAAMRRSPSPADGMRRYTISTR